MVVVCAAASAIAAITAVSRTIILKSALVI
jgi:hypothetical protein